MQQTIVKNVITDVKYVQVLLNTVLNVLEKSELLETMTVFAQTNIMIQEFLNVNHAQKLVKNVTLSVLNVQLDSSYTKESVSHLAQLDFMETKIPILVNLVMKIVKLVTDQVAQNVIVVLLNGSTTNMNVLIHAQKNIMVNLKFVTPATQIVKHVSEQTMENVILVLMDSILTSMDTLVLMNVKMGISQMMKHRNVKLVMVLAVLVVDQAALNV